MEALIVCVLDEPVLRWLDVVVGCMVAISAATGNPCGFYDLARYLLLESQNTEAAVLRLKIPQPRAASTLVAFDLSVMQPLT